MACGSRVHSSLPESSNVSLLPASLSCLKGPTAILSLVCLENFQRDFGALVNIFKLPKGDSRAIIVKSGLESDYCSTWAGRVSVRGQAVGVDTRGSSLGRWLAFAFLVRYTPDPDILYLGNF